MVKQIWVAILVTSSLAALNWDAGVDYIYWKASGSDVPWVATEGPAPANWRNSHGVLRADYHSGVRAEIGVGEYCGWSLTGRYAWVEFSDTPRFTKPSNFGIDVIGQPAIAAAVSTAVATASQTMPVHMAELFASYQIASGRCSRLEILAGATFLHAWRSFSARYLEPILPVRPFTARNRFTGAGPMIGLRNVYSLLGCLDIVGELSLLTVIGEIKSRSLSHDIVGGVAIIQGQETVTGGSIGGQLRLACRVNREVCGMRWSAILGWEQRLYAQVTSTGSRADTFVLFRSDDTAVRNLFIGGPTIGLGVRY